MPRNRAWASKAPLVGFIFANTRTPDGREPRTAQFDTGAAWMALTLQARLLGIYTHAMAGIDRDAAHATLGVDAEQYTVMCGFAAGRIGPAPRRCHPSCNSASSPATASRSPKSPTEERSKQTEEMSRERPNIVFILTDDQGPWAAGCSGNRELRTSNDPEQRRRVRELRGMLESWFAEQATAEHDGRDLPVAGGGQLRPVGGAWEDGSPAFVAH